MTEVGPSPRDGHVPVLLTEVIAALEPRDGCLYVDATFGGGGYSRALLAAARTRICAIDRDPEAVARAALLVEAYPDRFVFVHGRFGELERILDSQQVDKIDGGVVFDVGVSSWQLDTPERGFSFREDGPLDMRMGGDGPSAADVVNSYPAEQLAELIHRLGGERRARAVARAIVAEREIAPITRTLRLADIVRAVVPRSADRLDRATRTFLALRVHVNDELGELERGLAAAERRLEAGGRLVVASFQSSEDGIVKRFLKARCGLGGGPSRHMPPAADSDRAPSFRLLSRRAVRPGDAEAAANPRARSARLRAAVRTAAPPWTERRAA